MNVTHHAKAFGMASMLVIAALMSAPLRCAVAQELPASGASASVAYSKPKLKSMNGFPPRFPQAALDGGLSGVVEMLITIDVQGQVKDLQLVRSSGHPSLDQSALNAIPHWTYHPALRDGAPIETTEPMKLTYDRADSVRQPSRTGARARPPLKVDEAAADLP